MNDTPHDTSDTHPDSTQEVNILSIPHLVLASASPARKGLMETIDLIPDEILPTNIDETPNKRENAKDYVIRIALEKAQTAAAQCPNSYIVAADTIAETGKKIIGKANNVEEARKTLTTLSGQRHRVYTGLCVITPEGKEATRRVCTTVKFKRLNDDELQAYLDSNQWQGKSGCYGVQSRGGGFVEWMNGSYSNVIGLPLVEVRNMLGGLGYPVI